MKKAAFFILPVFIGMPPSVADWKEGEAFF